MTDYDNEICACLSSFSPKGRSLNPIFNLACFWQLCNMFPQHSERSSSSCKLEHQITYTIPWVSECAGRRDSPKARDPQLLQEFEVIREIGIITGI